MPQPTCNEFPTIRVLADTDTVEVINTQTGTTTVYDGTTGQPTSGEGSSASSAYLRTYVYTAVGGEVSLSGPDDNGKTLAYTPGLLTVHKNNQRLFDGTDYSAADGSSLADLSALAANDVVVIDAFEHFKLITTQAEFDAAVVEAMVKAGYFRGKVVDVPIVAGVATIDWQAGQAFRITNTEAHTIEFVNAPETVNDETQTIYIVYTDGGAFGISLSSAQGYTLKRPTDHNLTLTNPGEDFLICTIHATQEITVIPIKNIIAV